MNLGLIALLLSMTICLGNVFDTIDSLNLEERTLFDDETSDKIIPVFSIAFLASLFNGIFSSISQTTTSTTTSTTTEMDGTTATTEAITTTTQIPQTTILMCAQDALKNINSIIEMSEAKRRKWKMRDLTCADLTSEVDQLLKIDPKSEEFCLKANIIKEIKLKETCKGGDLKDLKNKASELEKMIEEKLGKRKKIKFKNSNSILIAEYDWNSKTISVNVTSDDKSFSCTLNFDVK